MTRALVAVAVMCQASVLFSISTAPAQIVSDSDFLEIVDPFDGDEVVLIGDTRRDSNFAMALMVETRTPFGSFTIPLTMSAGGLQELRFDTSVTDAQGNRAITQGPLGRDSVWVIKSSLVDSNDQTISIGYVSFSGFPPQPRDTLCLLYFDLDSSDRIAAVVVDSGVLPPASGLHWTGPGAQEYIPTFRAGVINIGFDAVGDAGTAGKAFRLDLAANQPNPFNGRTVIRFELASNSEVTLTVYNVLGQRVSTLINHSMTAGAHKVDWDARDRQGRSVPSGTYFYRLTVGDAYDRSRSMTYLK